MCRPEGSSQRLSDRFRAAEKTTVDSVNDWLSTDLPTAKESSIETLDGILTTLNLVEFEVDVPLRIRVQGNVNDVAVFLFAFCSDIVFELLDPGFTFFPVELSVKKGKVRQ